MTLVQILSDAVFYNSDAHKELTARWVKASGLTSKHKVGDEVTFKGHTGTIVAVNDQWGQYTINVPGLGHVKPGRTGTNGTYVNWEVIDNAQ